jgi:hypothetical protein
MALEAQASIVSSETKVYKSIESGLKTQLSYVPSFWVDNLMSFDHT